MPRPRRCSTVANLPVAVCYKPQGIPLCELNSVILAVEALEAMRLVDAEGLSHEEAASLMQISRPTLTRILAQGRQHVALALTGGLAIRIAGGSYRIAAPGTASPAIPSPASRVVAISAQGPELENLVDPRFGRAQGFLVVTLATMAHEFLDNAAGRCRGYRAGLTAAARLAARGVDTVLTGLVGPRAMAALAEAGITLIQGVDGMTVAKALESLRRGALVSPQPSQIPQRSPKMDDIIVAVPSLAPGGLEAEIEQHFGHSEVFTLVTLRDGAIGDVAPLPGMEHHEGGCVALVAYLAEKGVNILIAGGMGMRPLMEFDQRGIAVFHGGEATNVRAVVADLQAGRLARFAPGATCYGH